MHADLPSLAPRSVLTREEQVDAYLRVLYALMLRDMRTRWFGSYWGYLVQVLWPVAHAGIILVAMHLRKTAPPFGDSALLFAATGAVPALAFQYISREIMKGVLMNKPLTYYPQVRVLDVMFSRIMVEIVSSFLAVMVLAAILVCGGINPIPVDPIVALQGYVAAILFGIGIGTINVAIVSVFPAWMLGYMLIGILLYVASGVYFLPNDLPEQLYSLMKWNPVLQLVEWVRLGYDPTLPIRIDYVYLFLWTFGSMTLGLLLERTIGRNGS